MDNKEEKILKEPMQAADTKEENLAHGSTYPFAAIAEEDEKKADALKNTEEALDNAVSADTDIQEDAKSKEEEREKTPQELKDELMENLDSEDSSRDEEEEEEQLEKPDYETEIAAIIKSNATPKALRNRLSGRPVP